MTGHIAHDQDFPDSPQNREAVVELAELISKRYPGTRTSFRASAAPEDPNVIHLHPVVDLIDSDEVVDLVIERELALQEQGIPIH